MVSFQTGLLLVAAFISFVPAVHLFSYMDNVRFRYLRRFVFAIALWSWLLLFKHIVPTGGGAYIAQLLIYTVVLTVAYYGFRTVFHYMDVSFPAWIDKAAILVIAGHLLVQLTNDLHGWVLGMSMANAATLEDVREASQGVFFYVHTALSYVLLTSALGGLVYYRFTSGVCFLRRKSMLVFGVAIVAAVILNVIHVFFYTFYVDPTYLAVVLFSVLLYVVVFRRDPHYALRREGRKTLLGAMREMYVFATEDDRVIECSDALTERFNLDARNLSDLTAQLSERAVLYDDINALEDKRHDKPYLYVIEKPIVLPNIYGTKGRLFLLYDETAFVTLIDQLEYLKNTDIMTGLYNRNYLETLKEKHDASDTVFGVVVSDLDGLKRINDTQGHRAGDAIIKRYAHVLKEVVPDEMDADIIRHGGDEFLITVVETDETTLEALADAIRRSCDKDRDKIPVSIGTARRSGQEPLEHTIRRADRRLYDEKRKRRTGSDENMKRMIET